MSFRWIKTPEALGKNIEEYGRKALVAVYAVAGYWGQGTQDQARRDAPWQDRTGNARSGLFYAVDGFGLGEVTGQVEAGARALMGDVSIEKGSADTLVIAISHTVFYGKFLELGHGGRYAIILSTIEANLPQLERMLRDLFK